MDELTFIKNKVFYEDYYNSVGRKFMTFITQVEYDTFLKDAPHH